MEFIIPKIKINLNSKQQYNKIPILVYADKLVYGIKAKNTCYFNIELLEAPKDLNMYLRVLSPNKDKFTLTPTKTNNSIFLVELKDVDKNIVGKYKFEIIITSGEQEMCIYQGEYRVKEWLDNNLDVYNKEVR